MAVRTVIKAILLGPLAIAAVLFSVANRASVMVVVDPFTQGPGALSVPVPLYMLVLGALILGVIIGGMFTWITQGKHRKAARASRRAADQARAEADRLRVELASISPSSAPGTSESPSRSLAMPGAGSAYAPIRANV